jgi:hypothetical protein
MRIGLLAGAGAAIGFGISYPLTAIVLRSFSPLGTAALQGSLGLAIIVTFAALGVIARPSPRTWRPGALVRLVFLGMVGGVIFTSLLNISVSVAGPTITGFVATLYSIFSALLAIPLLGEPLRRGPLASFLLALAGTALLAGFRPADVPLVGVAIALASALCFGLYLVLSRRWGMSHGLDGTAIAIANLTGRGPIVMILALATNPAGVFPADPKLESLIALGLIVIFPSMLSQLLVMASVRRLPARYSGSALLLVPLTGAVVSVLVLGIVPTLPQAIGGLLIVTGIAGASGALELAAERLRLSSGRRGRGAGT